MESKGRHLEERTPAPRQAMSQEIETARNRGGLGSLALILIFGAVIAVLGKSLYTEYVAGDQKTANPIRALDHDQRSRHDLNHPPPPPEPAKDTVVAPAPPVAPVPVPVPPVPVPVPPPVQVDVDRPLAEKQAQGDFGKRPGAPVAAVGTVPAGGETLDIITGDPREELYQFGSGPMTRNEALARLERQVSVWNFLLRANQLRKTPEESFIWENLCTQPEQQAANDEFKKKDLIDSKRADFATRMAEAGRIKTIRLRSHGKFGQYDFRRGSVVVTSYRSGFATTDRTYGLTSRIALNKLEAGQVRQLLPVTLNIDEETARAITANNPERLVWIDVEGTIVPSSHGALAVSTTRAVISAPEGSRTWEVSVK